MLSTGADLRDLEQAIKRNETADNRCVGFTIETKPDYCQSATPRLDAGTRRDKGRDRRPVTSRNNVYKLVNRGHTLDDVVDAFRIARESGYKIVAHMMPGLPEIVAGKRHRGFQAIVCGRSLQARHAQDISRRLCLSILASIKMHDSGKYRAYSRQRSGQRDC